MRINSIFIFIFIVGLLQTACTLGPDFQKPDIAIVPPKSYYNDPGKALMALQDKCQWWKTFNDPKINEMIINVMENNLDIQKAAAQVREIQSVFKQTQAARYPTLDLSLEAVRQRSGTLNPFTGNQDTTTTHSYGLSLPAAFEIDLWGRLARANEAAQARLLSAEENRRTLIQTLIAEAVTLYLNIESIERQIQVNKKSIDAYRSSLKIVEGRYQRGLTGILEVRQASRALAQAEAQLPELTAALGIQNQSLAMLQGQYPKNHPPKDPGPDYFKLPPDVPPGLPSTLIARRPDIQAAEASLHAACAQIGVARAARFPQLKLTGALGYGSDELNTLFDPESQIRRIAAGGIHSLFDAGKRAAGQRAAQAQYDQALIDYAKTILTAFGEVEGALLNRQEKIERRNRLLKYRDEALATLDVATDRYNRGLVDYLTVLDARQVQVHAELQLITVEYELLSNYVRLCRALGGGWDLTVWQKQEKIERRMSASPHQTPGS